MRMDDPDRVDRFLRNVTGTVLALIGLGSALLTGFVLLVARNGGLPFSETHVSYWEALIPGVPAFGSLVGAWFVFPAHRRSVSN
jgi:hypothetical protein